MKEKKEVSIEELFQLVEKNPVRIAIIMTMDVPKISSHIRVHAAKWLAAEKKINVSRHLRFLERKKIVKCLTPRLKLGTVGRVYGLGQTGIEIKKILCEKYKITFEYDCQKGINYYDYGWAVSGSEKRALFHVMSEKPQRNYQLMEATYEFYTSRKGHKGISRYHVYDLLREGMKRKLFSVVKEERKRKKPIPRFFFTKKGARIKQQMEKAGVFQQSMIK